MWPPRTRSSGGKGEQHNDNGRAGDIACPHFSSPGLRIPYPRKRLLKFARPVQRGRSYSSSVCRIDNPEWECFDFGRRTPCPCESRHDFKPSRPAVQSGSDGASRWSRVPHKHTADLSTRVAATVQAPWLRTHCNASHDPSFTFHPELLADLGTSSLLLSARLDRLGCRRLARRSGGTRANLSLG